MNIGYKEILSFFSRYILPSVAEQKARALASIALLFASTGLLVLAMDISRLVIQAVQQRPAEGWLAEQIAFLVPSQPGQLLAATGLLSLIVFSIASLTAYLRDVCFEEIALRLTAGLRKRLFHHLLGTKLVAFRAFESSVLVKRLISDLANVRMILVEALMLRSADAALFLGLLIYLFLLSWKLTIVTLLGVAVYFAVAELSARMIGPGLYRSDVSNEKMTAHLNQAFGRLLDIKSNQRERDEEKQFEVLVESDYRIRKSTIKTLMLDRSLTGWLSYLLPVAITLVGGFLILGGTMQLDQVLVFVAAINILIGSVDRLTEIPMIISRTGVSVHNIEELFALPVESAPSPAALATAAHAPLIRIEGFRRRLSDDHFLQIPALEIGDGEKVAIIGPSGCGKSSLFSSLLKFDDQYQGSLKIKGMEVAATNVDMVRAQIAYMHQHSMLLPDDVAANVAYSDGSGEQDIAAIRQLVEMMELDELLAAGAEERDLSTLSGGQKRRLCLARALYRNAPLLLLDEPLTGVSPAVARQITQRVLARDEAVVMVTHQYEDLGLFDRVILFEVSETEHGRLTTIRAQGRHASLLESTSDYRQVVANG